MYQILKQKIATYKLLEITKTDTCKIERIQKQQTSK